MNLFSDIRALVIDSLNAMVAEGALPDGLDFANVTVEPPRDPLHGDMATNAAMVLAKPAKQKPRDIADLLAAKLSADPRVSSAEVAGPGFLNLRLGNAVWQNLPKAILTSGRAYGKSDVGQGKKVNVEYVSANPTGPLHVGHTRGKNVWQPGHGSQLAGRGHVAGVDCRCGSVGISADRARCVGRAGGAGHRRPDAGRS
jgi:arginyl-tRNA synthetase